MTNDEITQAQAQAREARERADWYRNYMALATPARRVLTQEECHVLAREADAFADHIDRLLALVGEQR